MEQIPFERLKPAHLLRVKWFLEATNSIYHGLCFNLFRFPGLLILYSDGVPLRLITPYRIFNRGIEHGTPHEVMFVPEVFPVRAKLGLISVVLVPVRVEVCGETIPVPGHI